MIDTALSRALKSHDPNDLVQAIAFYQAGQADYLRGVLNILRNLLSSGHDALDTKRLIDSFENNPLPDYSELAKTAQLVHDAL